MYEKGSLQVHSKPTKELLGALQISQATYYRLKKSGKLESKLSAVTLPNHYKALKDWQRWRGSGLYERPWSDTYREHQTYQLRRFFKRFHAVSAESLEQWLSEVPPQQQSKRQDMHSAVSSFARYMLHSGDMGQDEYNRIVKLYPKKSPYYQPQQRIIYSEDLARLLVEASKGHSGYQSTLNKTLLLFLSETGLRASELCALTSANLRFSDNPKSATILVYRGKGGKSRTVPFSKAAQEAVREYQAVRPAGLPSPLFWAFNPKHGYTAITRDVIARRFKQLSDDTGIPFSAHSLRHYRITAWANNPRIPITVTQRWAGHSSLEVTQKYIHIRDEEAMEAAFE